MNSRSQYSGSIVDVGGGCRTLLAAILRRHPRLRGVVFDLPLTVADASEALLTAGMAERCTVIGGDCFAGVPAGGDIYILHRIIHDWDDQRAARILTNCSRVVAARGKLLLIEKIMPERATEAPSVVRLDLDMLVMTGGRQRTLAEYRTLLADSGFRVTRIIDGDRETSIIEAEPCLSA